MLKTEPSINYHATFDFTIMSCNIASNQYTVVHKISYVKLVMFLCHNAKLFFEVVIFLERFGFIEQSWD